MLVDGEIDRVHVALPGISSWAIEAWRVYKNEIQDEQSMMRRSDLLN